jgi:hypothetical protein
MKTVLKISLALTWFNLVVWGFIVAVGILMSFATGNMYGALVAFLMAATVLHSYASLKLHKSIRHSNIPLSDQTPAGIRFVGFVALFVGIMYVGYGVALWQTPGEFSKMNMAQMPAEYRNIDLTRIVRVMGVFCIIIGIFVGINVLLNIRLLRWYYLVKQSDIS